MWTFDGYHHSTLDVLHNGYGDHMMTQATVAIGMEWTQMDWMID
jgi:hypothetical protein